MSPLSQCDTQRQKASLSLEDDDEAAVLSKLHSDFILLLVAQTVCELSSYGQHEE
jgi:hypothetical protein